MKKVNVLIVLAGLFITGVMIYLMMAGVKTRQRKMVSWSSVATPHEAGQKIGKFFFPILREKKYVYIESGDAAGNGFVDGFYEGMKAQAGKISPHSEVFLNAKSDENGFKIIVRYPRKEYCRKDCQEGSYQGCVCLGAIKKYDEIDQKKIGSYMINLIRLSQKEAVLFYEPPKTARVIVDRFGKKSKKAPKQDQDKKSK